MVLTHKSAQEDKHRALGSRAASTAGLGAQRSGAAHQHCPQQVTRASRLPLGKAQVDQQPCAATALLNLLRYRPPAGIYT